MLGSRLIGAGFVASITLWVMWWLAYLVAGPDGAAPYVWAPTVLSVATVLLILLRGGGE